MANLKIIVAGVAGKMGRAVVREALASPGIAIAGGFERPGSDKVGLDLGPLAGLDSLGIAVAAEPHSLMRGADVLIDFTTPSASVHNAQIAAEHGVAHIIGTTGFSAADEDRIRALASKTAIVKSGNMSLGVNLLAALVKEASALLGIEYDIEIVEAHHRAKIDAPSGTALMLGRAAAEGRGIELEGNAVSTREGARPAGAIGFAVVRGGGIVGDHDVLFAGAGEVLTLSHRAIDRGLFAKGAVAAAKWAAGKPPGLYSMADVLQLRR